MNSETLPVVRLRIERRSNHPWIFQKMVDKPVAKPKPGSIVDIVDNTGAWVGALAESHRAMERLKPMTLKGKRFRG